MRNRANQACGNLAKSILGNSLCAIEEARHALLGERWIYQFRNMGRNLTKSFHFFNGSECVYEKNIGPSFGKSVAPDERFLQGHGLPSIGARHNHNIGAALCSSIHGGSNLHHRLFPGQHLPSARVPTRFRRNLSNSIRSLRTRTIIEGVRKERGASKWPDLREGFLRSRRQWNPWRSSWGSWRCRNRCRRRRWWESRRRRRWVGTDRAFRRKRWSRCRVKPALKRRWRSRWWCNKGNRRIQWALPRERRSTPGPGERRGFATVL